MGENKILELMRSAIREELTPVQDQLNHVEVRLDKIDQRMDKMEQTINGKLDDILTDLRSEAKHLTKLYERQQGVIEILSSRSVQQEADIKAIKRMLINQ